MKKFKSSIIQFSKSFLSKLTKALNTIHVSAVSSINQRRIKKVVKITTVAFVALVTLFLFHGILEQITYRSSIYIPPSYIPSPDTTRPTINITSPQNKTYVLTYIGLIFTVDEATSWIGYSLDDQTNVTITGNAVLPEFSEGSHTIVLYATDMAGNMGASSTIHFTIYSPPRYIPLPYIPPPDTTPPTITVTSPQNTTYTVTDINLTFMINEATSWVGYSLDGQTNVTILGKEALSGLSEGSHTITLYANDTAGNMGASSIIQFTVYIPPCGMVTTCEVGAYWDKMCNATVYSIDWGLLEPGQAVHKTLYVKNEGNCTVTLCLEAENWSPPNAYNYLTLSWDYTDELVDPQEILQVTLTLQASPDLQEITNFNFDIAIYTSHTVF